MTARFRRRFRQPTGESGTTEEPAASEPTVTPTYEALVDPLAAADTAAERKVLLRLCLYAMDRARSSGVAERIEAGLAEVGVHATRPDGQRFDPTQHEAAGAVETEDPALEGLVAGTETPGFHDRGQLLRAPVVTVYTLRDKQRHTH